ncbi:hypothetical protein [Kitasatospora sp. A2-31]|uniref:hypothetical protein n=1 Tax=Kitasatospora sp. A2-31 TaxID=2916414 RepID=UPI001EEAB2E1|nr:hypothetical protein [Kitasatospora sp. A2-31]MCG6494343.1 hypothetical protein [Kitasatospora sp. A2-31]
MRQQNEVPADHRLSRLPRAGAGRCGAALLAFGAPGRADGLSSSAARSTASPAPAREGRRRPAVLPGRPV